MISMIVNKFRFFPLLLVAFGCETWHDFVCMSSLTAEMPCVWSLGMETDADLAELDSTKGRVKAVVEIRHRSLKMPNGLILYFEADKHHDTGYGKFEGGVIMRYNGWVDMGKDEKGRRISFRKDDDGSGDMAYGGQWRASMAMWHVDFRSDSDFEKYLSSWPKEKASNCVLDSRGYFVSIDPSMFRKRHIFVEVGRFTVGNRTVGAESVRKFVNGNLNYRR